jgi:thioredoxin-like negative regulator of GroEL
MSEDPISRLCPAADAKRPGKKSAPSSRRVFGRRVKFIWGACRVIRGRWYLGLFGWYDRVEGMPGDGLAISVRGLLLWGLGCSVALYCGSAAAIYAVRSRNPYNLVGYSDVLLWPWQRARMSELTGRALLAAGQADLKERRYAEGVSKLRAGLLRCPTETQAHLALAQLYVQAKQRPLALKTLLDRLDVGYPGREFMEALFALARESEDYGVILDACNRYRTDRVAQPAVADRAWLLQQQVQTLLAARRAGEALQLAKAEGAAAPAAIKEARVLALIDLGQTGEAREFLAAWRASAGHYLALVVRLQVRVFGEARQFDEMEAAIGELRALTPADPNPAVYGTVQRALAGRGDLAAAALDDYFSRFGGSRENLLLIMQPLTEIAALPLVQRCFDRATSLGYDLQPFRVQLFQAQMRRSDWTAAQRILDQLHPLVPPDDPAAIFWLKWQERLLAAATDPSLLAQKALLEIFLERPLPLPVFYQTCTVLLRANRLETAHQVLDIGQRHYPASSSVARLLAEAERTLGAQ